MASFGPIASAPLASQSAVVGTGATVDIPAAGIAIAGVAPVIAAGASVAVPAVDVAVAALAPVIAAGASVAVPAADTAVAALAPAVEVDLSTTVNVPAGEISLAALAPQIAAGKAVSVPAAEISLAALAPSVGTGATVSAQAADVAIAALAPEVATGASVAVPAADTAVAGLAPTVAAGAAVAVPAVDIAVAGLVPAIDTSVSVNIPAASITIAALAPQIIGGVRVGSREIPASMAESLDAACVAPFFAVDLEFATGPLYLWTGLGNVTIDGREYLGAGSLLTVGEVEESAEISAKGARLTLTGVPTDVLALAFTEQYQGRVARVHFGFIDGLPEMAESFTGYMDQMTIEEGPETSTVELTVESRLIDLERSRVRRYTNNDHQSRFPGDLGLEFVEDLQDREIFWGRTAK